MSRVSTTQNNFQSARAHKSMPKISVVMAVHNGERYMQQAIESILAQTFSDFEYIIVDDGSSDQTLGILQEYAQRDQRILILQNSNNQGLTKSLNKGIRASQGEYIARMDADDISHPDRFKLQIAFLNANPNAGLVGSWYIKIDERGKELWRKELPVDEKQLRAQLIRSNPLPHASLLLRRQALEKVGLYDESWKVSQDYELLFRMSWKWNMGVVPAFLLFSRVSSSSVTNTRNRQQVLAALRARRKAIQRGQYSRFAYLYFFLVLPSLVVPVSLRQLLKRFM